MALESGAQLALSMGCPVHAAGAGMKFWAGQHCVRLSDRAAGHAVADAWHGYAQVKTIAQEIGVAFLGIGFDPKWQVADVPVMPKNRYRRGPAPAQRCPPPSRGFVRLETAMALHNCPC